MQSAYGLGSIPAMCMLGGAVMDDPPQAERTYEQRLRIVYAGLLNLHQEPAQLVRALRTAEQRYPGIAKHIHIDYYGPRNFYTVLFLRRFLSPQVQFHGYIPLRQVLRRIAAADLGYLSLTSAGNAYCIPSKLYQYLGGATPILAAGPPEGAVRDLIEPHQIGRYSAFDDLAAQAEDLKWLLEHPAERRQMSANMRRLRQQFSTRVQTGRLSEFLQAIPLQTGA
jgi:glycosyltransferase involved in cell wall biosynthesis